MPTFVGTSESGLGREESPALLQEQAKLLGPFGAAERVRMGEGGLRHLAFAGLQQQSTIRGCRDGGGLDIDRFLGLHEGPGGSIPVVKPLRHQPHVQRAVGVDIRDDRVPSERIELAGAHPFFVVDDHRIGCVLLPHGEQRGQEARARVERPSQRSLEEVVGRLRVAGEIVRPQHSEQAAVDRRTYARTPQSTAALTIAMFSGCRRTSLRSISISASAPIRAGPMPSRGSVDVTAGRRSGIAHAQAW